MSNMVLVDEGKLKEIIGEVISEKLPKISVNAPNPLPTKLASEKELCEFLGIGSATANRWRQKRKIPFVQIGVTIRYDLQAVVESLTIKKAV